MAWTVESSRGGGIFLPQIGWHLDAHERADASFVSHAHSDHLGRHRTVLCTGPTARLMAARLPGRRETIVLPYDESWPITPEARATLYPAGHILGSAQVLVENAQGRLLYTGDFKLRPGLSAEPCRVPPGGADVLIMETTFGKPRYRFPPDESVAADIVDFCRRAIDERAVPLLFCYSLGKSQEVLARLGESGLPIMLHAQTARITAVYEACGMHFPAHRLFDPDEAAGHVVIGPPQINRSPEVRRIRSRRTAMISGWALDPWTMPRHRYDAAFPLSDHADYDDLVRFVAAVRPRLVYTVHGFAAEFARDLRERGIEAWALGRENQLDLGLFG
ncbi:MAG: MBL fold metallo-hydrolase [Opitutaceae bacterium]|nr:MBL fold metallo-hydrolase [Opitutaceae bacterium]